MNEYISGLLLVILGIILTELFHYFKNVLWNKPRKKPIIENGIRRSYELINLGNYGLSLNELEKTTKLFQKDEFPLLWGIILNGKGLTHN